MEKINTPIQEAIIILDEMINKLKLTADACSIVEDFEQASIKIIRINYIERIKSNVLFPILLKERDIIEKAYTKGLVGTATYDDHDLYCECDNCIQILQTKPNLYFTQTFKSYE